MSERKSVNARDQWGRFGKGNKFATKAKGVPKRMAMIRAAFIDCATPEDVWTCYEKLFEGVKRGKISHIKEFLNRLIGPAVELDVLARMAKLEKIIKEINKDVVSE